MKRTWLLFLLIFTINSGYAQLRSPSAFLGYSIGTRFSPHHKIVEYFRHVAEVKPDMVRVEQYGQTNEGRPLILAYISSPGNIARLESIRINNIRLAGMSEDRAEGEINTPVIVWLSYNVHGNEASSSEAAMFTLFNLVNPANAQAAEWLKNVVVIIDPCMNPDGRDRYVNWFNSVVGYYPNPNVYTREHEEPWPGGRVNHYYFDLNRDWAWQTQAETQQRIVKYNEWLPEVHVDFHEQGYNDPYYFAPAAEPFHEVITSWQREFQNMIGRNNARYFDQKGWLYFTKERFDLFYPSYGDTYPLYKGAIGMTFEQAGHSRAGTAVINEAGDTLTLLDRIMHHYTTGISTIEVSSKNARRLVEEFKKYYEKARTAPTGEFKAFLVKSDEGDRLVRLEGLLDRNQIEWGHTGLQSVNGINYLTGKAETIKIQPADIIINSNQPNSNLLKVLFERKSTLTDSLTYDITAWNIPYSYGLVAYGLNNYVLNLDHHNRADSSAALPETAYAYAVPWTGLNSAKFLAAVLNEGVKVRFAELPFSEQGHNFNRGTLLITRTSNTHFGKKLSSIIAEAADSNHIACTAIETGFVDEGFDFGSDKVRFLKAPNVGLIAGDNVSSLGMGEVWHFLEVQLHYPVNVILDNDLDESVLEKLDVLILADGNYRILSDKGSAEMLHNWVINGGKIIALGNTVAQLARGDWGIKMKGADEKKEDDKKEDRKDDYSLLKRYESRERDYISSYNPGSIFRIDLDNSHPLAYGYGNSYYTLKQDGNIYEFIKESGWNVGVLKKDNYVAGFTGSLTKDKLKDGLLFGVKDIGRGNLVLLADDVLFRSFWENGKLLFCNAIFMVGQ